MRLPETPDLADLIEGGRLRLQDPDRYALEDVLAAVGQDLAAAADVADTSPGWSETILYQAGLRCARVIVQAAGYRIAADRGHVTAIDAADALTDGREHRRFARLHRMRRMRHDFVYETARDPSVNDLEQARKDVEALRKLARKAVERLQ